MSSKYGYAVGRIRTLEARMLDQGKITRLAEAHDFESAFAVLNETVYARHFSKLAHPFDFDELLRLELNATVNLLEKLAPNDGILKLLLKKYTFQDEKTSAKLAIEKNQKETNEAQNIDLIIDKKYLELLKKSAKEIPVSFLRKIVLTYSELLDIKISLRKEPDKTENITAKYRHTDLGKAVEDGVNYYLQNKSFSKLEMLMDNYLINQIKRAKYFTFGIEPLIGFYLAKEYEINNIRMILTCKKNHINQEQIKERVRIAYV